jgi:two-component system response regulator YesN
MKRMPVLISKSVLLKFIISFMAVFLLPLFVLGIVIYQDSYVKVKQTLEQSASSYLEQLRSYTESRLKDINYTTERIRFDYALQHYTILEGPEAQLRAIERLHLYKSDNSTTQELLLYLHGQKDQDLVFTSRGIIQLSALASSAFRFSTEQQQQFIRIMRNTKSAYILPAESVFTSEGTQTELLMFLFPIPENVDNPRASLLFFIPKSGFEAMIQGWLRQTNGVGGIMDQEGRLLAGFGENQLSSEELLAIKKLPQGPAITPIRLHGESFTFIQTRSDRNNWIYWALLPEPVFYKPLENKLFGLLAIGIGISIFGVLLIIALSFMHYRPVSQFLQAIRIHFPETKLSRPLTEWKEIKENLQALETRKAVTRHQIIENLLYGRESYQLKRHYLASGLILDFPWTAVVLFRIERTQTALTSLEIQDILNQLELNLLSPDLHCYIAGLERLTDCALLLNSKEPDPELLLTKLELIQVSLSSLDLKGIFGVGTWQPIEEGIHRSFVEASAALDYVSGNKEENSYAAFSEMKSLSVLDMDWFPVKEQLRYLQSLKQGDTVEAIACLHEIMSTVRERATSFLLSKYVCLHLITEIVKTIQQEKLDYQPEDVHHLVQFTNVDSLETNLVKLTETICSEAALRKSRQYSALAIQIVDYIYEGYARPELSLDLIADHFRISPSHVSKLVKGQTDKNFASYLSYLRIDEAKRLLVETNYAINDIVIKIGYIDPKNFMRKFKNETGMTLGDYRKLHKHTKDKDTHE